MQIELVVFDMAGTTVSEGGAVYKALRDTLAENGLKVDAEAIHQVKGTDKREALRVLIEQSEMRDELLPGLKAIHEDFVERLLSFYRADPAITEFSGTSETFRRLKANGIKVALNTGFSRDIAQTLIDRLGWERQGLIDASITSDEVEAGRPHPFMIRALMQRLGINETSRVAKVGDAPADLLEGKNAGCGLVIGVTYGSSTREQLTQHPHDHLIDSIAELQALQLSALA
ncbi:MAG: phosphonatase-like hydrolase [Blastocatellia bacterium]